MKYLKKFYENNSNLITLYHGSDSMKPFKRFKDNQFFSEGDYVATTYAFNHGGLLYKVSANLNPFELIEDQKRMQNSRGEIGKGGPYIMGTDFFIEDLILKLYDKESHEAFKKRGLYPGPGYILTDNNYLPLINYAKEKGFNSLKFWDESFDAGIRDICYIIFNGDDIKIDNIYEVYMPNERANEFTIKKYKIFN
jgi:hypothetical protein